MYIVRDLPTAPNPKPNPDPNPNPNPNLQVAVYRAGLAAFVLLLARLTRLCMRIGSVDTDVWRLQQWQRYCDITIRRV